MCLDGFIEKINIRIFLFLSSRIFGRLVTSVFFKMFSRPFILQFQIFLQLLMNGKKDEVTKFEKLFLSPSLSEDIPSGFFDGAQNDGWCCARMILYLIRHHNIKLNMGIGNGKNTTTGLLSLWGFL